MIYQKKGGESLQYYLAMQHKQTTVIYIRYTGKKGYVLAIKQYPLVEYLVLSVRQILDLVALCLRVLSGGVLSRFLETQER